MKFRPAQTFFGCFSLLSGVLAVYAAMGAYFRIEANIKIFFFYQAWSLVFGLSVPVNFLVSGSLCKSIVDERLQRMGSSFACGFADTFFLMWLLILGLVHAYLVYIVWSAGEEIRRCPYPELERYRHALKAVKNPDHTGKHPVGPSRAIPGMS